ncbi:MAG: ABC transporter permease [Oscillospiraceae bacterium]|nr:ABC transporter permease [Oscillospiraceae bacterium]
MFWRILKKDLKRKKTMNVILLLFVVLSAMFASAAVNNIAAVTGGIEHYFDAAGVPDLTVMIQGTNDAEERIRALPDVTDVKTEHYLFVLSSKNFVHNGKKLDSFINPAGLISGDEMAINYFTEDNEIIRSIEQGTFYASGAFIQDTDIKKGDPVTINLGDTEVTLKYMGRFKGALFSNETGANPYLLLNPEDYGTLDKEEVAHFQEYKSLYVTTGNVNAVRAIAKEYDGIYVTTRDENKGIYLYDMIAAYIMMMISIVLMVTAFVVLRFTIGFTISEEFREIGVMKAVGIGNGSIRRLYIVKYLAIAVIGAVIGFLGSVPLSGMMMKNISANMVLGSESSRLFGLVSSAAVVAVILLFCYFCTRRVRKLSPIDAVRSGQTGERFGKKSLLHLGRSRLPSTGFLAANDVLSAPKQFSIIAVIFTLCFLMIGLMSNFSMTLQSEKILWLFQVPESEAHILDTEVMWEALSDLSETDNVIHDTEKMLAENGMPGTCTMTMITQFEASHGEKNVKIAFAVIKGHTDDTLRVDEGTAPQKADEIVMTASAFKDLGVKIGDRITAVIGDQEYEFLITGRYSAFATDSAMMHSSFDFGHIEGGGTMGIQILFDGNPDKKTIDRNVAKLRELLDSRKVYSTPELIRTATGISETLDSLKMMMMILTVIITALIAVLMERSFISKEKSEIALMKAVGIPNRSIIAQHTLRFVIAAVFSCILSFIVLMPLSNFLMNKICLLIGDVSGIRCDYNAFEIFAVCPLIIVGVTLLGAWLTALYTGTIKASDTASIE